MPFRSTLAHLVLLLALLVVDRLDLPRVAALSASWLLAAGLAAKGRTQAAGWPAAIAGLVLIADLSMVPPTRNASGALPALAAACLAITLGLALSRSAWTRALSKASLFAFTLFAALTALDVALSVARPDVDLYRLEPSAESAAAECFVQGDRLKWRYAPRFAGRFVHPEYGGERFTTNDDGYRDLPWPAAPDEASKRVLVLGDSMTVGLGVEREETYAARLEEDLARRLGGGVRVFNGAVAGYGPLEQYLVLLEAGRKLDPHVVVALFYDGNDLDDASIGFRRERELGHHALTIPGEAFARAPASVWEAVQPENLLDRTFWRRVRIGKLAVDRGEALLVRLGWMDPRGAMSDDLVRAMRRQRSRPVNEGLFAARAFYLELAGVCVRNGWSLLVLRLPARHQNSQALLERALDGCGIEDASPYDRSEPGRTMIGALEREGIATLDLLPAFEASPRPQDYYFAEGHLSRAGHAAIAELVAPRVAALLAPGPRAEEDASNR